MGALATAMQNIEIGSVADWVSGIATFLAVLVALKGNRASESKDARLDAKAKRISAEQITLKLADIGNDLMSLRSHTIVRRRSISLAQEKQTLQFEFIEAVFGDPSAPVARLSSSEASDLIAVGAAHLAMSFTLAAKRLSAHQAAFADYKKLLDRYESSIPPADYMTIAQGVRNDRFVLSPALEINIRKQLSDLESASRNLVETIEQDVLDVVELAEALPSYLKAMAGGREVLLPDVTALRNNPHFPRRK